MSHHRVGAQQEILPPHVGIYILYAACHGIIIGRRGVSVDYHLRLTEPSGETTRHVARLKPTFLRLQRGCQAYGKHHPVHYAVDHVDEYRIEILEMDFGSVVYVDHIIDHQYTPLVTVGHDAVWSLAIILSLLALCHFQ